MRIEGGFANNPLATYRTETTSQTKPAEASLQSGPSPSDGAELSEEGLAKFDALAASTSESFPPEEPLSGNGNGGG